MKNGWPEKTLGEIATVAAGNSAPQDEVLFKDGIIPFFRTADAGRVRFGDICESEDYLNEKGAEGLRRFPKGTILFPKSGASTFLNHRVMLGVEGCVSSHLATIVADEKQAHPRFLLYFLSTVMSQDLVQDHAYPSLNLPTIEGIRIRLPSREEQRRLAGILDEAFEGIATAKANAEKNLQNASALFASHVQSVFSRHGKGWVEKSLGECFRLKSGDGLTSKAMKGGRYPVFGGNGIAGMHDEFNLSGDNVIIGRVGALCGNARHITEKIWLTDNAFKIVDCCFEFDGAFLTYLLNFKDLRNFARQAAQPVISNSSLKELLLAFPEIAEQKKIAEQLNALAAETRRLEKIYERKLSALEALKKSLLHQAFTGNL